MANTPLEIIAQNRLVPVIALEQSDLAVPLAEALIAGGLPIAEITIRTAAAEQVIRSMVAQGGLCVGAGTVLSIDQVDQAQEAGAQFIVSPGFNPAVVRRCLDLGLTVFPGTRPDGGQVFSGRSNGGSGDAQGDCRALPDDAIHSDRRHWA